MNIRSLSSPVTALQPSKVKENTGEIKFQDTAERDADGRQPFGEKKRRITEDELNDVIEKLKTHPGVIANNLSVEITQEAPDRILLLKGADGQIIRRVHEADFIDLLESIDQTNGRIFHKAA